MPDAVDLSQLSVAILCGGLGTRLRTSVSDRPKVLAEVNGRPFVTFLLDLFDRAGVRHVVLCCGYMAENLRATLGAKYRGIDLDYSVETQPLGTGGAARLALPKLRSSPVMILNGDSYCRFDPAELLSAHARRRAKISMLVTRVEDVSRYGSVRVGADDRVERFDEKGGDPQPGWINAGVYVFNRDALEAIEEDRAVSFEREVFPTSIAAGIYVVRASGPFLDIGTPESYARAESFFASEAKTR